MFSNFFEWFVTKPTSNVENKVPENSSKSLTFQLEKSLLEQARVIKKNIYVDSGKQACKDFSRASFIINGKRTDKYLVKALIQGAEDKRSGEAVEPSELQDCFNSLWKDHYNDYIKQKDKTVPDDEKTESYKVEYKKKLEEFYNKGKGYAHLFPKNGEEGYRPFAKIILEEIFKLGDVDPSLINEIIRSCNQAGHEAFICDQIHPIFAQYGLVPTIPDKTISIRSNGVNSLNIEYSEVMVVKSSDPDQPPEQYKFNNKLKFTLEFQKNEVVYKSGEVEFTIPKEFEDNCANGTSLLDDISEHFGGVQPIADESFVIVSENPNDDKNTTTDDDLSSFMTFQNLGDAGFPSFIEIAKRRTVAVS